eukprot:9453177-Pyramimonas_sp.AAC.1
MGFPVTYSARRVGVRRRAAPVALAVIVCFFFFSAMNAVNMHPSSAISTSSPPRVVAPRSKAELAEAATENLNRMPANFTAKPLDLPLAQRYVDSNDMPLSSQGANMPIMVDTSSTLAPLLDRDGDPIDKS